MTFLYVLFSASGYSQPGNFYIRSFNSADYQSENHTVGPQNYDVIADSRGVIYIANSYGILEFDGTNWRKVTAEDELRYTRSYFTKNSMGRIFVGSENNLGYLAADSSGLIHFKSLTSTLQLPKYKITSAFCIHDTVYFVSDSTVLQYDQRRVQSFACPGIINMSTTIGNKLFFSVQNQGLFQFNRDHFQLIPGTKPISLIKPIAIFCDSGETISSSILKIVGRNGIYQWNGSSLISLISGSSPLTRITSAFRLNEELIAIGTDASGLIISDFSGKVMKVLDKTSGLNDNAVNNIYLDQQNGLWLALSNGISRIEFPEVLTYFNVKNGLEGIVLAINQYHDQLYAGTYVGMYQSDITSGDQFRKDKTLGFIATLLSIDDGLMISSVDGIFLQHDNQRIKIADDLAFQLYHSPQFPDRVFLATDKGVGVLEKKNKKWKFEGFINHLEVPIKEITSDNRGFLIAGENQFFRIDFRNGVSLYPPIDTIRILKRYNHQDELYLFSFYDQVKMGSSSEGFLRYDPNSNHFVSDSMLNKILGENREVKVPYVDSENNLWFSSNTAVKKIFKRNGNYTMDTVPFMLIPKTEVWNFFRDQNQILWIGTNEGIYRYDESIRKKYDYPFNTLLRSVRANNSSIFNGAFSDSGFISIHQNEESTKNIPYKRNDIVFEYAGVTFDSKEETLYSYLLEGNETDAWSAWSPETKKEYTGLPEGDYIFHVRARNIYGAVSNESTFQFTILTPWYRTWWAYLIYGVLFVLFIRIIIQVNQWRLINEKKLLTKKVEERTIEIFRQKELVVTEKEKVEHKTRELETTLDTLRQTQSQLIQSEKMASIGLLTAGIAHEINNPINFVSGNVNPLKRNFNDVKKLIGFYESLLEQTNQKQAAEQRRKELNLEENYSESEHLLDGIEEGSRRTALIVKGLRNFSRLDTEDMKLVKINEGIESTLPLIRNKLSEKNIEIVKSLGNIPEIHGYPGQLNQVFMNLLTNAIDAISTPGKIFITTSYIRHAEQGSASDKPEEIGSRSIAGRDDNGSVVISIRDTGKGMSEEVKQKIFDPFFTTKEVGKGTGLGLSISYGIIEKHKGKIEVKTEPGKGTEFIILLPV